MPSVFRIFFCVVWDPVDGTIVTQQTTLAKAQKALRGDERYWGQSRTSQDSKDDSETSANVKPTGATPVPARCSPNWVWSSSCTLVAQMHFKDSKWKNAVEIFRNYMHGFTANQSSHFDAKGLMQNQPANQFWASCHTTCCSLPEAIQESAPQRLNGPHQQLLSGKEWRKHKCNEKCTTKYDEWFDECLQKPFSNMLRTFRPCPSCTSSVSGTTRKTPSAWVS